VIHRLDLGKSLKKEDEWHITRKTPLTNQYEPKPSLDTSNKDSQAENPHLPKRVGVYDRPEKKVISPLQILILLALLSIMAFIVFRVVF
jgi:hypothetical protein